MKNKGFTLVEAMVAISILSLAITGPLLIAQKGLGSAIYSKDQTIAFYLAQEAVEYIRNVRDTNRANNAAWLNSLSECLPSGGNLQYCEVDARKDFSASDAIMTCSSGTCDPINFDSSTGLYGYGTGFGTPTKFTRTVSVDNRASTKEAAITVTISWNTSLFSPVRTFTIRETIFNF